MSDVVAGDIEGLAVLSDAPHDDMGVGVASVVMVDPDPVEPGPEVGLHLLHQIAGGLARIGKLLAVLGRDDEAKLMAVLASTLEESAAIFGLAIRRIDLSLLAVLGHAIAFQVPQVGIDRLGAGEPPSPDPAALRVELHDASL